MANFWKGKKVLVTGGSGFIGSYVCEILLKKGAKVTITTHSSRLDNISHIRNKIKVIKGDLRDYSNALLATRGQEVVMHLAAKVAGVQYNLAHQAEMFSENIKMVQNIADACVKNQVKRLLITSSTAVYSKKASIPTPEEEGFFDEPDAGNSGYAWSKRVAELIGRFYSQEYGLEVAIARPGNVYGPRDYFDPSISHVVAGIIKRVFDGENPLIVWGSGKQTRAFIYAEDFARGLVEVTEKYATGDPVNIGTKEETSIGKLAKLIVDLSGKKTKINFDSTKPDGLPRSNVDTKKAREKLGFEAKVTLKEGLRKTIEWYKKNQNAH